MNVNEMDDKELTILALKQRIGELVADYEERVAELRVSLTRMQGQLQELGNHLIQAQAEQNEAPEGEQD